MAPSDPATRNHGPTKHSAYIVMSPAGEDTFSPRCSAHDFVTDEIFDTINAAKLSKGINEHVDLHRTPKVRRRW